MTEFRAIYPSAPDAVSDARRAFVTFARASGFDGELLRDLELAVGEALANAVEHGRAPGSRIELSASYDGDAMTIEVKDDGCGFATWKDPATAPRSVNSPRGFGILIMRAMFDRVRFFDGGTRVVLVKRKAVDASAPASDAREA